MVNKQLLKSKMVLNGDTISSLAKCLGISRNNLSNKINNKLDFNNRETSTIALRYNLSEKEIIDIFGLTNERC